VLGWKMIANGALVADAEHVVEVVQRQADALLAGDREGWLAPLSLIPCRLGSPPTPVRP
jgi:hypothetical protein